MDTGSQHEGANISPPEKNIHKIGDDTEEEIVKLSQEENSSDSDVGSEDDKKVLTPTQRIRYSKESLLNLDEECEPIEDLPSDIKRIQLPKPSENRWIPPRFDEEKDEDSQITMIFRSILNKMTPEKYNNLLKKLLAIEMKSEIHLLTLINLIFEKATTEPKFSEMYSQLCIDLRSIKQNPQIKSFNYLIVNQCGIEFKKCLEKEVLTETTDPNELELRESKMIKEKERKIGLMKFIAELYKRDIFKANRVLDCMDKLVNIDSEDSLEQFYMLFFSAGSKLTKTSEWGMKKDEFIEKIVKIRKATGLYSTRLRFKFQDLLDLIDNNWTLRGVSASDAGPRTLKDVKEEAERTKAVEKKKVVKQKTPKKNVSDDEWVTPTKGTKNKKEKKSERKQEELKSDNPFDLLGD